MHLLKSILFIVLTSGLAGCQLTGPNPDDPYEPMNRSIYKFNAKIDQCLFKPIAKTYAYLVPNSGRAIINNFYTNINMLPTVANDLLQADFSHSNQDAKRFVVNSIIGVGGLFDPATRYGFPLRSNDLGLTFAKWGDKRSPYIMIPLLGPSTIRDSAALLFDYTIFTPYPWIPTIPLYSLLAERYVDLRAQMLDSDRLIAESLDKYSFIRDAYLQHRRYLLSGETQEENGSQYVEAETPQAQANSVSKPVKNSEFPLTTSNLEKKIPTNQA